MKDTKQAGQRVQKEGLLGKEGGSVKTRWQDRWVVVYEDKTLTYRKWRSEEQLLQGTIKELDKCSAYPTGTIPSKHLDIFSSKS